jgi:hypothetical protein
MRKTSVYITDEQAIALRRAAEATGRSQAALIRQGIELVVRRSNSGKRVFHSMGIAHSGGHGPTAWDADELYDRVMGLRG